MNVIYHYTINFDFSNDAPNLNIQTEHDSTAGLYGKEKCKSGISLFQVTVGIFDLILDGMGS